MSRTTSFARISSMVPSASTAPRWSTVTYPAMFRTKSISCSTTISVARRLISRTRSAVRRASAWVMPAVGSSRRTRSGSDVSALEVDRPRRRLELTRQELEQRALAGAVGADHAAQLAAPQGEVEGVDGPQPTELLHQTPRLEHDVIHRANSGAGAGRPTARRTAPSTAGSRPRGNSRTITTRTAPSATVV